MSGSNVNSFFTNIESKPNVKGVKDGFDYSKLDSYGLVKENTPIDDRIVLIGEVTTMSDQKGEYMDNSKTTKKGQLGFVDKAFISEGEEGFRIAKIRIREERLPAIGDKFASRAGQKGTIGLLIPEEDMPFTSDGVRPDLIINPHALPSRMTIGQLIESLFGKACCMYGGYGDCTAFSTKGANYDTYGHMLTKMGYHNSGNQLLYNGYTGEQVYSEIYIGPTYYMRLKHMVKDKINYRAAGKRNFLTRQTNQGRANDGGLKIGEMERDGIMANGLSYFLNESYMVRGDQYYMAVCNKTGTIAVYNPDKNIFLSPFADGPLVFNRNVEGQEILDAISKFGRTFSVVRIPFAMKLLMQELQAMNIQMRIITEDNIDQLTNLSYQSRNIDKLLHIDHGEDGTVERDIKEIVENYRKSLEAKLRKVNKQTLPRINAKNENPQLFDSDVEEAEPAQFDPAKYMQELGPQQGIYGQAPQGYYGQDILPNSNPNPNPNVQTMDYGLDELIASPNESPPNESPPNESPQYVPGSPAYAPSNSQLGGGSSIIGSNIFPEDPQMNAAFNKLNGSSQATILQMEGGQRQIVMGQIMRQSINNSLQQNGPSNTPLAPYFEALPVQKQLTALQGGYNAMSKEFNQLAGAVHNSKITISKPQSVQQQLEGKLPLLSIEKEKEQEQKGGSTSDSSLASNSDSGSSSSSSNNSSIKKISFM